MRATNAKMPRAPTPATLFVDFVSSQEEPSEGPPGPKWYKIEHLSDFMRDCVKFDAKVVRFWYKRPQQQKMRFQRATYFPRGSDIFEGETQKC